MTINYSKQVLLKRGNTAVSSNYIGPVGEITLDTDLLQLRVHDGETSGGWIVPNGQDFQNIQSNLAIIANVDLGLLANVSTLLANANSQQTQIDSLLSSVADIVTLGNTAPGTANETFWFNETDGRLYIKQDNVWTDSSPTILPTPGYIFSTLENIAGNIIPDANNTYSLGSPTAQWKDVWVSNATIYFDSVPMSVDGSGNLTFNGNPLVSYVDGNLSVGGNVISGGGGNPFDQDLNANSAVTFYTVGATVINVSQINGTNPGNELVIQANNRNWTFGTDGAMTLPNGMSIDSDGASGVNAVVTIGGDDTRISIYNDGAPPGLYITANATGTAQQWTFGPAGDLSFPDGSTQTTAYTGGAGNALVNGGYTVALQANGVVTIGANATISNDGEFRLWATDTDITVYRNGQDGYGVKAGNIETYTDNGLRTLTNSNGFELKTGNIIIPNDKGVVFANGVNILDTITGVTSISTSVSTLTVGDASGDYTYGALSYDYAVNGVSNSFSIEYSAPLAFGNVDIRVGNVTTTGTANVANLIISGTAPGTLLGSAGDTVGMVRVDSNYIYYCTSTFVPASWTVGWGGATSNTLFLTQGDYPTPQVGWIVDQGGNGPWTIDTISDTGYGSWQITWVGTPHGSPTGGTATLTNPNPSTIWSQTPLAATTYANTNVAAYLSNFDGTINFTASPAVISGLGNIASATVWTGNLQFIDGSYQTTAYVAANTVTKVTGTWSVTTGTNNYSFTVPVNGAYHLWVRGNIPSGILSYLATVHVTNDNVAVLGTQRAWNYTGDGSPLILTSMPSQIVGAEGTISTATVVGTTNNTFVFGISNTSGGTVTVSYGYTKIS